MSHISKSRPLLPVHRLGVDVATRDINKLWRRLSALKSTQEVERGGVYRECAYYSQLYISTTLTESQLDDWLYRVNHGADYVGVFSRGAK